MANELAASAAASANIAKRWLKEGLLENRRRRDIGNTWHKEKYSWRYQLSI